MKSKRMLALFAPLALALAGCAGSPTFLSPQSSIASEQSDLYRIIIYLSIGVFVLVEALILYSSLHFAKNKDDNSPPKQVHGNTRLEIIWTALPVLLVITIFFLSVRTVRAISFPGKDNNTVQLQIVGHRWWWEFDYPELGIVTANELHIPVGAVVEADLSSVDVIHSFWVPQLSGKVDAIPGQMNNIWFRGDEIGEYHGQCAEFCGLNHANMRIKVVVESQADFEAWVADQQQPPPEPQTDQQQEAYDLIVNGVCSNCHTLGDHQATNPVGPNLTHLFSRSVFAGATYDLTEDNIRLWLTHNQDMKPGNDMVVNLTPEQVDALMSFLVTLK